MGTKILEAQGFLFIGDPHLASRAPGRRKDVDFVATVVDKLQQAFAIANDQDLQPVIIGDLFHRERDSDNRMKTLLFRALRSSHRIPWCLVGNHDLQETELTDETALAVIAASGTLDLMEGGAHALVDCGGLLVGLGATPYGQPIPASVPHLFSPIPDQVLWVTHADIQFQQPFPQSLEPFEIEGCDIVVNGHLHKEQPSVLKGSTLWVNPGNITRVSVDTLDHVPGVLRWTPVDGLLRIPLNYLPGAEVFDLRGRLTLQGSAEGEIELPESEFVRQLQTMAQPKSTAGASLLMSELREAAQSEKISEEAWTLLLSLMPELDEMAQATPGESDPLDA